MPRDELPPHRTSHFSLYLMLRRQQLPARQSVRLKICNAKIRINRGLPSSDINRTLQASRRTWCWLPGRSKHTHIAESGPSYSSKLLTKRTQTSVWADRASRQIRGQSSRSVASGIPDEARATCCLWGRQRGRWRLAEEPQVRVREYFCSGQRRQTEKKLTGYMSLPNFTP